MQHNLEGIAHVAHEANRAYCATLGDVTQVPWAFAPEWQRSSAIAGVKFQIDNPQATPEQSHNSWLAEKEALGWTWGAVKDVRLKQHPCMTPYACLPKEQRLKDSLFQAIVRTLLTEH